MNASSRHVRRQGCRCADRGEVARGGEPHRSPAFLVPLTMVPFPEPRASPDGDHIVAQNAAGRTDETSPGSAEYRAGPPGERLPAPEGMGLLQPVGSRPGARFALQAWS